MIPPLISFPPKLGIGNKKPLRSIPRAGVSFEKTPAPPEYSRSRRSTQGVFVSAIDQCIWASAWSKEIIDFRG
jgi:hypothetical protein